MNLTYGSQGEEVRKLQNALNSSGYGLAVDGIYGSKTQAAVRDYQSKNGLSVDGIAGTQTQGKLYGTESAASAPSKEVPKAPDFSYDASTDAAYQDALKSLQTIKNQGAPTFSATYDQQLNDIYNQIMNRDKFSYNLDEDALYNQYKDQYTQQGRMAMMDTMGQAAALTGGYSSSYGQAVGQQQYDAYLQSLNDIVPDLYSAAYDRYNAEGNQLLQQYQLTGDLRDTEYSRYQDEYNRYMNELQMAQNQEREMYDRGYQDYINNLDMQYQRQQDAYDKAVSMISTLGYMPSDAELALAGMSPAEAQRWMQYYQDQQALAMAGSGGGGGGGRSSRSYSSSPAAEKTYNNGKTMSQIESDALAFISSHPGIVSASSRSVDEWLSKNGYTGESSQTFKAYLVQNGVPAQSRR